MALFGKLFSGPNIEKLEGKNDIKGLIKALNNKSEDTRIQVIDIENLNLDSYLVLMNMGHDSFKLATVNVLGNIGNNKAIDVLIDATKSPNENIRTDAFLPLKK